jgi:ABC-type Fe3+/spermidine/putrescine transport system ATPase subunit
MIKAMAILTIKDLTKSYGGHAVLVRLALSLGQDEIVAIMGKSGAGKTTLLSCILGFERADTGTIELDGRRIDVLPIEERQIAYMPQDYGLFPHLSVYDNIAFGLMARKESKEAIDRRVHALLQVVELSQVIAKRDIQDLSGGEQQRVALARALAIEPRLFLFDEPLSAIDREMRAEVGASLRAIIKKLAIPAIVITHDLSDAQAIADAIYRMEAGALHRQ